MSKKRHAINIPGVMLDSIRDNTDYENDERFTKRQKINSKVFNRKENRKQNRLNKKNQKKEAKIQHKENFDAMIKMNNNKKTNQKNKKNNKKNESKHIVRIKDPRDNQIISNKSESKKKIVKRVSFSDHDDIREIPSRTSNQPNIDLDFEKWEKEFTSDSEDTDASFSDDQNDSQDEEEENDAHNLIETLKHLKQVQRGEYSENIDKNINSDSEEDKEYNTIETENLDNVQKDVMNQLAKLKAKKGNNSNNEIRIVKEDDLSDDSFADEDGIEGDNEEYDEDLDDEQKNVMDQLKKLKGSKITNNDIKIIKEDDLNDDSFSEDEEEEGGKVDKEEDDNEILINEIEDLDHEQQNIMKQLAALKSKKNSTPSNNQIRIVKEDELSDTDGESDEDESDSNSDSEEGEGIEEEDEVMKKLATLKQNRKTKSSPLKIVKEDDLDDDSLSSELNDDVSEDDEDDEENYDSPAIFDSKDNDDLDYYAKKLGIDSKSKLKQQDNDDLVGGLFDGLDFIDQYDEDQEEKEEKKKLKESNKKEEKSKKETKIKEKKEKEKRRSISDYDSEMLKKDDEDINYYAKKLGIDPKKSLTKQDDDDIIGGLFDGINLDFSDNEEGDSSFTASDESDEDKKENKKKGNNRDDEIKEEGEDMINSDDFDDDDDLDDDDKALLREMYGLESSDDSDSEFDSDDSDDGRPRIKENPYMAPVESNVQDSNSVPGSKYIPPALRKKMALGQDAGDSEELKKIMRLIKGPFNKLSEPNIISVISELNNLYNDNPRQFVNEAILKVVLQSISISTPMLESFLVLYASAIVAIYKLQGVEFGAYIIQHIVEEFEKDIESASRSKQEIINITGLLGYLYTLNLINSTLIYDIIKMKLIKNPTELKTDVLLKLIKSCGSKLRTDDSTALNSIILELTKSVKENEKKGIKTSTRTRFLIDTITDLKNNRLKNSENENTTLMINRLKKQLGSINNSRNLDPIKVNLDDIENIEERGKWWLVGSAWKGNDNTNKNVEKIDNEEEIDLTNVNDNMEDELLGGLDVNWIKLAKECRMNTDIRRAIFISIMSADDFMDAFMKLEKLNLKKSQKSEIPNILMHCATMESIYNPYYSYLAKKLSDDHLMRRSFQLNLWDFIKELDGEETSTTILLDADDDQRLWKILNMGRFFGFLIGEGSLSLNVLRTVNFLTASSDVKIFLEILLITVLDVIAKKSKVSTNDKKNSKNIQYNNKIMSDRVSKCDEQQLLIKGLQYFLNNKVNKSKFIKGKKQRGRVEWGIDTMSELLSEILKGKV